MAIARRAADLAFALRRTGVVVTLGAESTYGQVRAAGEEERAAEGGPPLRADAVTIVIPTGSLTALRTDVVLGAAGVNYHVHRCELRSDRAVTHIIAYPTGVLLPESMPPLEPVIDGGSP